MDTPPVLRSMLELVEVELQFRARSVPPPPPPLEVECTSQLLVQYTLLTWLLHLRMPCWWPVWKDPVEDKVHSTITAGGGVVDSARGVQSAEHVLVSLV